MKRIPGGVRSVLAVCGALVAPALPVVAETTFLPSSSFRAGANGAEYRTDVRILNQGAAAVTVTATFYDQVTSAALVASAFRVEARSQAAFDNVLQSLFGRSLADGAYGPIRFESTGPLLVAASVNNVNACGSGAVSGQWLPGLATSQALKAGVIGQLAVSADPAAGYRTNLVFVNAGSVAATATVKVRRGGGALLSTATIGPLSANGFRQVSLDAGTFPGVAGTTDTNLWLEFTSDEPLLAYATIIHNASGDPFAVVATADVPPEEPAEVTYTLPGGVPLVLVRVPAGTFQMGSPSTEKSRDADEGPVHSVTLTRDYYVGKYEVTQAQWQAVTGSPIWTSCGTHSIGPDYPVYCLSWNDLTASGGFLEKLRAVTGEAGFRLPTEAEWERAARGGTSTRFSFGDAPDCDDGTSCGACAAADPYALWCGNASGHADPVGRRLPNGYGLYDMHGNIWEWLQDRYDAAYYAVSPSTDPTGPTTGNFRVLRSGGFYDSLKDARSAARMYNGVDYRYNILGFRLALTK